MNIKSSKAIKCDEHSAEEVEDILAVEAPLHVKVNGESYTTTLRTPGDDQVLVRGLLFSEGIFSEPNLQLKFTEIQDPESGIVACVEVEGPNEFVEGSIAMRRSTMSTSSCGMCGTRDPADISVYGPPLNAPDHEPFDLERLPAMMREMHERQHIFRKTGGVHCAALFTLDASILASYEDIGRHNAVDKCIGSLLFESRLKEASCLLVSGRLSYEIVYKAYRAELPILASVSAPSSMAVETAERMGMTVLAFCRDTRATIYSRPARVAVPGQAVQVDSELT